MNMENHEECNGSASGQTTSVAKKFKGESKSPTNTDWKSLYEAAKMICEAERREKVAWENRFYAEMKEKNVWKSRFEAKTKEQSKAVKDEDASSTSRKKQLKDSKAELTKQKELTAKVRAFEGKIKIKHAKTLAAMNDKGDEDGRHGKMCTNCEGEEDVSDDRLWWCLSTGHDVTCDDCVEVRHSGIKCPVCKQPVKKFKVAENMMKKST